MTVLCVIGARGGSQGLPGKNTRPILGKPLIAWSIEQALAVPDIDRVVVSTDSEAIAEVARAAGAEVPFLRPAELAGPGVGKFQVWQHAVEASSSAYKESYEFLVDLDCTNPLREPADITAIIQRFRKLVPGVDAMFTVCPARKNPYFNLVEPDKTGCMRISKCLEERVISRQSAPQVFEHVASIYVLAMDYLRNANHLLDGRAVGWDIGAEKSLDIDTEFDFSLVEYLMRQSLVRRA